MIYSLNDEFTFQIAKNNQLYIIILVAQIIGLFILILLMYYIYGKLKKYQEKIVIISSRVFEKDAVKL